MRTFVAKEKAARRRLSKFNLMIGYQAAINAGFDFRRYAMKPMPAKPRSIIAHVEGSGTPPIGPLPMPALNRNEYWPAFGVLGSIENNGSRKASGEGSPCTGRPKNVLFGSFSACHLVSCHVFGRVFSKRQTVAASA